MHVSDSERDLTALHGPSLLNGTFSRDTSMRDVLEMVAQFKDIEFGLFRILSKELRGYFAVSFGRTILGAHTTSSREFGVPALRELLGANRGMFIFAQLKEFPVEVRQSLEIPLAEMLNWRPEGVPPTMVASLQDALHQWEPAQAALESSECMDALRFGTLPASMDAAEEEASFMGYYGDGVQKEEDDDRTPAKPLSALLPKVLGESGATKALKSQNPMAITVEMPPEPAPTAPADRLPPGPPDIGSSNGDDADIRPDVAASWAPQPKTPSGAFAAIPAAGPHADLEGADTEQLQMQQPQMQQPQMQQPQMPIGGWSKTDLDSIGRVEMPVEEPKAGLGVSGRLKPGAAGADGLPEELRVSQRVHRPDPELSASGRFIAAEIVAAGGFQPGTGPHFDPRSLMEPPPAKKPLDLVVVGCIVVSVLIVGWAGFDAVSYLMSSGPSEVNAAANEIRLGNDDVADAKLRRVLKVNDANPVAKITLAVSLVDRKKYDEAITACNDVLKSDPDAADAFRIRAVAHAQSGMYDEAIKDVDAYLKAAPEDDAAARSQALAVRAYSHMKLDHLDDSIADYSKAIKLDEKNLHLFASRGAVREMKKQKAK